MPVLVVSLRAQLTLPVMAVLHVLRQGGWMSIVVWQLGGSLPRTLLRGLANWTIMMMLHAGFELRRWALYNKHLRSMQEGSSAAAADSAAATPALPAAAQSAARDDAFEFDHPVKPARAAAAGAGSSRSSSSSSSQPGARSEQPPSAAAIVRATGTLPGPVRPRVEPPVASVKDDTPRPANFTFPDLGEAACTA